MNRKLGTFKKQQDGVKKIAFFRIFIDIMECFVAACGVTLMISFLKLVCLDQIRAFFHN